MLAVTTFQSSSAQLIAEHLQEYQHKAAQTAVAARLAKLTGRLKQKDNYVGQAGWNLYEDVRDRHQCLYASLKMSMPTAHVAVVDIKL